MTLPRAVETWALAVVNSLPRAAEYLATARISAPETAPTSNGTEEESVNETPQVVCKATILETDYALKCPSAVGAPARYGSKLSLAIALWTDATKGNQEEADEVAGLIYNTLSSPPMVESISVFSDFIVTDEAGIDVEVDGDKRAWVVTREVRALLR